MSSRPRVRHQFRCGSASARMSRDVLRSQLRFSPNSRVINARLWKHGSINPNVFKDLISHSRPIENQGDSLVYEVPINKTIARPGFSAYQVAMTPARA
jgi:hypothetical protein